MAETICANIFGEGFGAVGVPDVAAGDGAVLDDGFALSWADMEWQRDRGFDGNFAPIGAELSGCVGANFHGSEAFAVVYKCGEAVGKKPEGVFPGQRDFSCVAGDRVGAGADRASEAGGFMGGVCLGANSGESAWGGGLFLCDPWGIGFGSLFAESTYGDRDQAAGCAPNEPVDGDRDRGFGFGRIDGGVSWGTVF